MYILYTKNSLFCVDDCLLYVVMEKLPLSPHEHTSVVRKEVQHRSMALPSIHAERSKQLSLFQSSALYIMLLALLIAA